MSGPQNPEELTSATVRGTISQSPVGDDVPRWFKRYWPIISAVTIFTLGVTLTIGEFAFWGARPAALFFCSVLLGLAPLTAVIGHMQRR